MSEPDFTQVELTPADRFLVLASDGVWEFITNQEAVDIVAQFESPEDACRKVCFGAGVLYWCFSAVHCCLCVMSPWRL